MLVKLYLLITVKNERAAQATWNIPESISYYDNISTEDSYFAVGDTIMPWIQTTLWLLFPDISPGKTFPEVAPASSMPIKDWPVLTLMNPSFLKKKKWPLLIFIYHISSQVFPQGTWSNINGIIFPITL